jgi:hypothetical protein
MDIKVVNYLLKAYPWTEFRTRIDLLDEPADSKNVMLAREKMIKHSSVELVVNELTNWPGTVLSSHKSAGQHYHKLSFLADIGVKHDDPKINIIIEKVFEHTSNQGPFQLPMNIPTHFGGTGQDQYAWALCDAPITVYSLAKMGLTNDERVIKAKDYLINLGRKNGYPCVASPELGKFRGPGKKDDPCPYATLIMLKLLNLYETDRSSDYAKDSIDSLLNLWENSLTQRPYIFYMGNDFRKLKAPFIWYDILHLADTLSNFSHAKRDKRFMEIVDLIFQKVDSNGLFTPESVWQAWKGWDFGQKKKPSAWLTFLVYRIKKRLESNIQ